MLGDLSLVVVGDKVLLSVARRLKFSVGEALHKVLLSVASNS